MKFRKTCYDWKFVNVFYASKISAKYIKMTKLAKRRRDVMVLSEWIKVTLKTWQENRMQIWWTLPFFENEQSIRVSVHVTLLPFSVCLLILLFEEKKNRIRELQSLCYTNIYSKLWRQNSRSWKENGAYEKWATSAYCMYACVLVDASMDEW